MYERSDHPTGFPVVPVSAIEKELGQLPTMPIAQLRERYRTLFRDDPHPPLVPTCCDGVLPIVFRSKRMVGCHVKLNGSSTD